MIQQNRRILVRRRRAVFSSITSIFFAMLMGSSRRLATIAFQHAYYNIRPRLFLHTSGSTRSSIISLQQTTTGWIRTDTLNFQDESIQTRLSKKNLLRGIFAVCTPRKVPSGRAVVIFLRRVVNRLIITTHRQGTPCSPCLFACSSTPRPFF